MHHQGNQFNHQSNVTSIGTNQNKFVDGAPTSFPNLAKEALPGPPQFALEETLVKAKWR
jgi:hypothetical protein